MCVSVCAAMSLSFMKAYGEGDGGSSGEWPERWWVSEAPVPDSIWRMQNRVASGSVLTREEEGGGTGDIAASSMLARGRENAYMTSTNHWARLFATSAASSTSVAVPATQPLHHPVFALQMTTTQHQETGTRTEEDVQEEEQHLHMGNDKGGTEQQWRIRHEFEERQKEVEEEMQAYVQSESIDVDGQLRRWGLLDGGRGGTNSSASTSKVGYGDALSDAEQEFLQHLAPTTSVPPSRLSPSALVRDASVRAVIGGRRPASQKAIFILNDSLERMREALGQTHAAQESDATAPGGDTARASSSRKATSALSYPWRQTSGGQAPSTSNARTSANRAEPSTRTSTTARSSEHVNSLPVKSASKNVKGQVSHRRSPASSKLIAPSFSIGKGGDADARAGVWTTPPRTGASDTGPRSTPPSLSKVLLSVSPPSTISPGGVTSPFNAANAMRADDKSDADDDDDDDIAQFMTTATYIASDSSPTSRASVDDGRHPHAGHMSADQGSSVEYHGISDSSAKLRSAAVRLRNAHAHFKGTIQAV